MITKKGISISYQSHRRAGDKPDTVRPIRAQARYYVNGEKFAQKFSTNEKCALKYLKNGKVYHTAPFANDINKTLQNIKEKAEKLYRQFHRDGQFPTKEEFVHLIIEEEVVVESERNIWDDFQDYIQYHNDKRTGQSTVRQLGYVRDRLKLFETEKRYLIRYEAINMAFYAKWLKWLRLQPGRDPGTFFSENTVGAYINKLKMFLTWSLNEGRHKTMHFKQQSFKAVGQKKEVVYLTPPEIDDMEKVALPEGQGRIRDWFVLATQIGMRYSDFNQLADVCNLTKVETPNNEIAYNFRYCPRKTSKSSGAICIVPLSKIALSTLSKYDFSIPLPPVEQIFNREIKNICTKAGIPKRISAHDARRTYATNEYLIGMPLKSIMKITGHRTEREFMKYISLDEQMNADMMRKHNPDKYRL